MIVIVPNQNPNMVLQPYVIDVEEKKIELLYPEPIISYLHHVEETGDPDSAQITVSPIGLEGNLYNIYDNFMYYDAETGLWTIPYEMSSIGFDTFYTFINSIYPDFVIIDGPTETVLFDPQASDEPETHELVKGTDETK